jgi:hypothetical protein
MDHISMAQSYGSMYHRFKQSVYKGQVLPEITYIFLPNFLFVSGSHLDKQNVVAFPKKTEEEEEEEEEKLLGGPIRWP